MKKIFIIMLLIVLLVTSSGCSFHFQGTIPDYEKKEYILEDTANLTDIIITDQDTPIIVNLSSDNKIHLEYHDAVDQSEYYEIKENQNSLKIKKNAEDNYGFFLFGDRVITDSYKDVRLVLSLPENLKVNLEIKSPDSDVKIDGVNINQLIIKSKDGDISLDNVSITEKIVCITDDGDVRGNLNGKESDYSITIKSDDGDSKIRNKKDGNIVLEVTTDDGDIDILFNE